MPKTWFVTGTDTDAGKTLVTAGLLKAFEKLGKSTAALKPVAAGCYEDENGKLRNSDADILIECQTAQMPYQQVNPVTLREPLSPHIAARIDNKRVSVSQLVGYCRGVMMGKEDVLLIEGAGGWYVPVNDVETLERLPRELNTPVILVVGMKLGCLNHAMLTANAIQSDGLLIAGWVANQMDPNMAEFQANVDTLSRKIPAPCLGVIPWLESPDPSQVAEKLQVNLLQY